MLKTKKLISLISSRKYFKKMTKPNNLLINFLSRKCAKNWYSKKIFLKIYNKVSSAVFCGNFENFSKKKLVDVGVSWNLTFSRSHEQRIKMNSKAESRLLRRDTYPKIIPFIPFLILPSLQETMHYPFTLK